MMISSILAAMLQSRISQPLTTYDRRDPPEMVAGASAPIQPTDWYDRYHHLASCGLRRVTGSETSEDFEEPIVMIIGPIIYGMLANLSFSLGWVIDMIFYRSRPRTSLYLA
jgi:hypothetical protein